MYSTFKLDVSYTHCFYEIRDYPCQKEEALLFGFCQSVNCAVVQGQRQITKCSPRIQGGFFRLCLVPFICAHSDSKYQSSNNELPIERLFVVLSTTRVVQGISISVNYRSNSGCRYLFCSLSSLCSVLSALLYFCVGTQKH
jgi:hypothetical protein